MTDPEDYAGMTEAQLDAELAKQEPVASLGRLWEPPAGMVERVARRAERRLENREAVAAVSDVLLLGWFTAKAVLGNEDEGD